MTSMFTVADAVTGYRFPPDTDTISRGFRYASVSYTALYPWRQGLSATHDQLGVCACLRSSLSTAVTCLFKSSWRKVRTMERTKLVSLLSMVVQSSLLALTTRYSRHGQAEGSRYFSTTAVLLAEMVKVVFCVVLLASCSTKSTLLSNLCSAMTPSDVIKSCVPSLLYTVQNNLHFVAVTYLDAATFQITYQLKILTTALVSVLVLRKRLDALHWGALVMLTVGVAMVQMPGPGECSLATGVNCDQSEDSANALHATLVGMATVLAMCVSSGFAGVYTEKILKSTTSNQSLWTRNLQLAMTSCVMGACVVLLQDGSGVTSQGFFYQYDGLTWCIVLQLAALGLVISMVMKHMDNLVKGFASSIAIVVTTAVSGLFLSDLHLSCSFLLGSVVVLASILLYNVDRPGENTKPDSVI